jgi:hypothetical protein
MSLETSLETSLEKIVAVLSGEGMDSRDRLRSALEIAETALSPEARAAAGGSQNEEEDCLLKQPARIDEYRPASSPGSLIAGGSGR